MTPAEATAIADSLIAQSCETGQCVEHPYDPALAQCLAGRSERGVGETAFAGYAHQQKICFSGHDDPKLKIWWHIELTGIRS